MLHEPSRSFPAPPGALNEAGVPDREFWGHDDGPRRRRRPPARSERVTGLAERRAALVAAAVIVVVGGVLALRSPSAPSAPTPTRTAVVTARPRRVTVHVAGAVTRPGVVDLPAGARVIDAVDAAGGALAAANLDRINLAAPLQDGEQVLVPLTGSPPTASPSPASTP